MSRHWRLLSPALGLPTVLATALLLCPFTAATTPLSGWNNGLATNYGSSYDGMSPGSKSFGTAQVRSSLAAGLGLNVSLKLCWHPAGGMSLVIFGRKSVGAQNAPVPPHHHSATTLCCLKSA